MKSYPKNIEDLLQSDLRKQVFDEISMISGRFSIEELSNDLAKKGIKASRNTIQQFLQCLLVRGVLRAYNDQHTHRRGRPRIHLEMITREIAEP